MQTDSVPMSRLYDRQIVLAILPYRGSVRSTPGGHRVLHTFTDQRELLDYECLDPLPPPPPPRTPASHWAAAGRDLYASHLTFHRLAVIIILAVDEGGAGPLLVS